MFKEKPKISVLVLGYNSLHDLEGAFSDLMKQQYKPLSITFIDNASSDSSVDFVKKKFPKINVVANAENVGYSRAFNPLIQKSIKEGADAVIVMNPDIRIDDKQMITKMVQTAFHDKDIALVQPKIFIHNLGKKPMINTVGNNIHYLGFGFVGQIFEEDTIIADREIVAASGACLLIKKQFFLEAKGFDPDFFAYMEDIDFSWRARLLGYKVFLCGTTYLWHKYDFERPDTRPWKMSALERNRYLTLFKNYSNKTILLLLPALLFMDFGVFLFSVYQGWWLSKIKASFQVLGRLRSLRQKKRWVQNSRKISDKHLMTLFLSSIDSVFVKNPFLDWVNPFFQSYYKILLKLL